MGLFIRLTVALVVLAVAYVLLAPRVPEFRGWFATHVCPYLDRMTEGLCARSLQVDKAASPAPAPAAQIDGDPRRPQSVTERPPEPPNVPGRPDGMASEIERLRQVQQWQDSALKQMEVSLAQLHRKLLGLEQAVDALRVEIERVRLGATAPPEAATVPSVPAPPARRPAQR